MVETISFWFAWDMTDISKQFMLKTFRLLIEDNNLSQYSSRRRGWVCNCELWAICWPISYLWGQIDCKGCATEFGPKEGRGPIVGQIKFSHLVDLEGLTLRFFIKIVYWLSINA